MCVWVWVCPDACRSAIQRSSDPAQRSSDPAIQRSSDPATCRAWQHSRTRSVARPMGLPDGVFRLPMARWLNLCLLAPAGRRPKSACAQVAFCRRWCVGARGRCGTRHSGCACSKLAVVFLGGEVLVVAFADGRPGAALFVRVFEHAADLEHVLRAAGHARGSRFRQAARHRSSG